MFVGETCRSYLSYINYVPGSGLVAAAVYILRSSSMNYLAIATDKKHYPSRRQEFLPGASEGMKVIGR